MKSKELFTSICPYLKAVERQISIQADLIVESWGKDGEQAEHIERVVHHLLDKPGKMLRPAMVMLSAGIAGWNPVEAAEEANASLVTLATAVELMWIGERELAELCYQNPGMAFHLLHLITARLSANIARLQES